MDVTGVGGGGGGGGSGDSGDDGAGLNCPSSSGYGLLPSAAHVLLCCWTID